MAKSMKIAYSSVVHSERALNLTALGALADWPVAGGGALPNYPSEWPKGCPPAKAVQADGTFYRIVKTSPPTERDFKTAFQLGEALGSSSATRTNLSLLLDLREVDYQHRAFKHLGNFYSVGTIRAAHGHMLIENRKGRPGSKMHVAWWIYEGVDARAIFAATHEIDE
jgi:hypothetical protein